MNGKVLSQASKVDKVDKTKWLLFWVLFFIGVAANYHFSKVAIALRLIAWLVLIAILGGIAYSTGLGRKAWGFAQEARVEIRKVAWPTRDETIKVTMVVAAMVIVVALMLWGIDTVLLWAIAWLTGQRG